MDQKKVSSEQEMSNEIFLHHFARLGSKSDVLGKKIMTGNENSVFQYEPETKHHSVQDCENQSSKLH
jgi:sulfur transfer protein SufE